MEDRPARERILDAVEDLVVERDLAAVPLLEICHQAEVSTSSLYHCFPTKEDLATAVHDRLLDRSAARLDLFAGALASHGGPFEERVRWGCALAAQHLVAKRGYLLSMAALERTRPDLAARRAAFHRAMVDQLADAIVASDGGAGEPRWPAPARDRLRLALRVVASTLLGALTGAGLVELPDGPASEVDRELQALSDQLAEMVCAYVGAGASAATARLPPGSPAR